MRHLWTTAALALAFSACSGPMRSALPDDAGDAARDAAKGCDRDETDACADLALMYWTGDGVARDVGAAVPLLAMVCDAGRDDLCEVSEEVRLGATPHPDRLVDAQACDRGDASGCASLGVAFRDGDGVEQDFDRANTLLARACDDGARDACSATEVMRVRGASGPVIALAGQCDAGSRDACRDLGSARWTGEGVDASTDEAVRLHGRVCDDGDVVVCAALGDRFMTGDGVARDVTRAVALYGTACAGNFESACERSHEVYVRDAAPGVIASARACDHDDIDGCIDLAEALTVGAEVAQDTGRAADLFTMGCEGGRPAACLALAELRQSGDGVARDAFEAASLFATACEGGELRACFELGSLYHTGDGVPRNIEAAFTWWQRACDGGLQQACDEMPGRAEAELPPTAPDALRNLARQCDRGTLRSCVELAVAREAGQGIARDFAAANRLYTRACFSGFAEACAGVRYPGACTIEHVDGAGQVVDVETMQYDRAVLAERGTLVETATEADLEATVAGLPDVLEPPVLDVPNVTYAQAQDPNQWAAGTQLTPVSAGVVDIASPNGASARLSFDAAGRLIGREPVPGAVGETLRLQRNADGRIVAAERDVPGSGTVDVRIRYDANGRVTGVTRDDRVGPLDRTTAWTYTRDARGELTEVVRETTTVTASGEATAERRQARFIRDDRGNLMRSDIRDGDRNVLEAANYDYACFAP